MKQIAYKKIVDSALAKGAILNEGCAGFREDYLVLHCLLRKYKPKRFFELGTNLGVGTAIIKNALGDDSEVLSLDLPTELAHTSKQHPISEGKGNHLGELCKLPFTQLLGDSMKYDYAQHYPIDGWFIDGEHDYKHPHHETLMAIESGAKIIIWHDADMVLVNFAIRDAMAWAKNYELYHVKGTRIAYAIKTKEANY